MFTTRAGIAFSLSWSNVVSVGETRAAQSLVAALLRRYPQHAVLITHMTPSGRATGVELFADSVTRCYLPYDLPWAVAGFLEHFEPRAGVLMETEIWPNLIAGCRARGIPLYLVNARLSEKSAAGYRRIGGLTRASLAALTGIAAQSAHDAERFTALGAANVNIAGNLKFDITPPAAQLDQGREWRRLYGEDRPVLLAASTREGEEALLLEVLDSIAVPGLLAVIVPRHQRRFDDVAALITSRGHKLQRRSEHARIGPDTRVVLGDSMGEMFAYYGACDLVFIGGSLLPFGGQNLIEACAVGKPVLIGPHVYNFAEATEEATRAGAAIQVRNARELASEATRLLLDPAAARRMGVAGRAFCGAHRGATDRILELIKLENADTARPR